MDAGSVGGAGTLGKLAVATVKVAHDAAKTEGKAMVKLLDGAAHAAEKANHDPEKGKIIDTHA